MGKQKILEGFIMVNRDKVKAVISNRRKNPSYRAISEQILAYLPNKAFLRPDEVAEILRISKKSVYRYVEEGYLQAINPCGGSLRIPRSSLLELIDDSDKMK